MNQKLRILLAEDHLTVREGIKMLVNAQPDMEVVGEADNGEIAIAEVSRLKPDMIIMDISMPVLNGLKATKRLREGSPDLLILALTRHTDDGYLQQLIGAGANGYVLKQSPSSELFNAMAEVCAGNQFISPQLMASLLDAPESLHRLTRRQREVIESMAKGKRTSEIAADLGISIRTVESHRQSLLDLLGVHSGVALIREAERLGLIPVAPYELYVAAEDESLH